MNEIPERTAHVVVGVDSSRTAASAADLAAREAPGRDEILTVVTIIDLPIPHGDTLIADLETGRRAAVIAMESPLRAARERDSDVPVSVEAESDSPVAVLLAAGSGESSST